MSERTRVVRLPAVKEAARDAEERNEGTCISVHRGPQWLNLKGLFNAHHLALAEALRAEQRPGVLLFVLTARGLEGSLWLAATEELRVGSLGRHDQVDLRLPGDGAISLRHCLVMVRRLGDGVRVHVLDLSSSAGLLSEQGEPVHALDADGHFFLKLPGALLAGFPTGVPLPWDPEAPRPFDTLAPRVPSERLAPTSLLWKRGLGEEPSEDSHVSVRPGPTHLRAASLRLPGEPAAGILSIQSAAGSHQLAIGPAALESGVILGRYDRCAGSQALSLDEISRVHAVLFTRDGTLFLADAGSTNGTWYDGREIRCAAVEPGVTFSLSDVARLRWDRIFG